MSTKSAARRAGSSMVSESVADQVINATDTSIEGSVLPFQNAEARARLKFKLWLTKTAAGVAPPSFKIRVGPKGDLTDTARLTFAGPAQTAAVDAAVVEIDVIVRSSGKATATVISGVMRMVHNLDSTGFAVIGTPVVPATSAGFDSTVRDLVASLSIDSGAAGVWTVTGITAEVVGT
jgi:hypothetical protein